MILLFTLQAKDILTATHFAPRVLKPDASPRMAARGCEASPVVLRDSEHPLDRQTGAGGHRGLDLDPRAQRL